MEAFKEQGRIAFSSGEYKKAAKIYRDALVRFGDDAVLFSNRAQCFISLQDWPRALKDAENGLRCAPAPAIKTKLLFRKGVALKHSDPVAAAQCFQQVLDMSPSNASAQNELDQIDLQRSKKQKLGTRFEVKVEVVDELPHEFRLEAGAMPTDTADHQKVEDVAKGLFGQREKKTAPPSTPKTSPEFSAMPSMHFLKSLRSVPVEKKQAAFSLVLDLEDLLLASLFQSLGVDADFLEFFLEAAVHRLESDAGHDLILGYIAKLELMSTFSRHQLTLSMTDKAMREGFLNSVDRKYPDLSARAEKSLT